MHLENPENLEIPENLAKLLENLQNFPEFLQACLRCPRGEDACNEFNYLPILEHFWHLPDMAMMGTRQRITR